MRAICFAIPLLIFTKLFTEKHPSTSILGISIAISGFQVSAWVAPLLVFILALAARGYCGAPDVFVQTVFGARLCGFGVFNVFGLFGNFSTVFGIFRVFGIFGVFGVCGGVGGVVVFGVSAFAASAVSAFSGFLGTRGVFGLFGVDVCGLFGDFPRG